MSTPVVHDGVVLVGSGHDGFLKPNDARSQIWGRPEGDDLYAFSTHDGSLLWKMHTPGQDMPSAVIAGGDTAIFANGDLHAYAVDLKTGHKRWAVELPGVATMASGVMHDGKVVFSTCRNAPYMCETRALDVRTGKTLWTNSYGGSDCTPAVADGLVFTNANKDDDQRFHTGGRDIVAAINENTGRDGLDAHVRRRTVHLYRFSGTADRRHRGSRRAVPADRQRAARGCIQCAQRKSALELAHIGERQDESGGQRRRRVFRRHRRHLLSRRSPYRKTHSRLVVSAAVLHFAASHHRSKRSSSPTARWC